MWRSNGALELRDGFSVFFFIFYFYRHSVRVYYIGSNHFLQLLWNQLLYSFLYGFTTNLSYLIFQMNPRNSHDSDKFILENIIHIVLTSKLMNDSSPLKKRKTKKKFINRVQNSINSLDFRCHGRNTVCPIVDRYK